MKNSYNFYRVNKYPPAAVPSIHAIRSLLREDFSFFISAVDKLRKYQAIWQMEDLKRLPLFNSDGIPIVFKKGETLCWSTPSTLKKFKKVTTSVSYSGLTALVKIAKGVRYRVGSLDLGRSTREVVDVEDTGVLWMTNQRIGFIGPKKNFTLVYGKILSFDVNSNGLCLRKEGREVPYIVGMDEL